METNDPSLRPGRHAAATPDRPPVSRRELRAAERREVSAAEFADTLEFPGVRQSPEPWPLQPPVRPRDGGTAEAEVPPAASHVADTGERRSGAVARRTAL